MLILSRKLNESIVIDGRITIKVMRVDGDVVKLGIAAPSDVPVHREEVYQEIRANNHAAVNPVPGPVPKLSPNRIAPNAKHTKKAAGRIAGSNLTGIVELQTKST
jgi:carbon storage regulator